MQQQPQQQQENDDRSIEEIQSASGDSMPEIAMNYQPHQPPKTLNFSETIYGKQKRSFQHNWFEKYPWLDYDVEEDSVTCIFCNRQNSNLLLARCKEETFLKTGYWKKATEKFDKHQRSKCHKSTITYETIVPQCRNAS